MKNGNVETCEEFSDILHDFEAIPESKVNMTIFNVAGYTHYENVCSNILAFYLNPNNEHRLGNLVFASLMHLAGGDEILEQNVQVNRELSTINGGRLDIVVETDRQMIGIENKIFHHLNNDLADYSRSIDEWAKSNQLSAVKIILSIKAEPESYGFINVTYERLLSLIRRRLGNYASVASQKWLLYLIDFLTSIENLIGGKMEITEADQFFIKNESRVNALLDARNKFLSKLNKMVCELMAVIEKPPICERQWIYAKSCLVHDFLFHGNSIAFDLYLSPKGWELQVFGRNTASEKYLSELFELSPLRELNILFKDSRRVLMTYDLTTDQAVIKEDLLKHFKIISEVADKRNANNAINSDAQ